MTDFMDDDDMDIRESDAQTRASEILYEELRQLPVTVAVAQALADHYAMILANQGVLVEGEYRPYGQMAEELRDAQIGRAAAENEVATSYQRGMVEGAQKVVEAVEKQADHLYSWALKLPDGIVSSMILAARKAADEIEEDPQ